MLSPLVFLVLFLTSSAAGLSCYDFVVGNANGTIESYQSNTTCNDRVQFCMTLNGSLALPSYYFHGIVGQCDGAGEPASMLKNLFGLTCWREGCETMPIFSLTRCCCRQFLCNTEHNIKDITSSGKSLSGVIFALTTLLIFVRNLSQ